jgi:hypothetical protein
MIRQSRWSFACLVVLLLQAACNDSKNPGPSLDRPDAADAAASSPDVPAATAPDVAIEASGGPTASPNVVEECAVRACSGAVADLCCPSSCAASTDVDCGGCGNMRMEPGELCDPPGSCPASCPQLKCQKRALKSAGTCAAICVNTELQKECISGDECCPAGCNAANDRDCAAVCGNGAVEPGEMCDPVSGCVQACPMVGCTLRQLQGAGTCIARCTEVGTQTDCRSGDGCCPPGCVAATDNDCPSTCGDGTLQPREACDPLSTCPTACPAQGCNLRRLINAGTCDAVCVDSGQQSACRNGDNCCPPGCNGANDSDCQPLCGNGVLEAGETCDPIGNCAAAESRCVSDAGVVRVRMGDAGTCRFRCVETPRACGVRDGACPPGCTGTADRDCAGCGNAVVEMGETCDPIASCAQKQLACVSDDAMIRTPGGNIAICSVTCAETPRVCGAMDGACPPGCTLARDLDCQGCGNGRLDAGETCDPVSACQAASDACVDDRDFGRVRSGDVGTCRFRCVTTPRLCGTADGVCPSACRLLQDPDCPGCGNGRVDLGESCDPLADCLARSAACVNDNAFLRSGGGDPAACGFACTAVARACGAVDGACPPGCGPTQDRDCPGCGNGILETGETCDPASECEMRAQACVSNESLIRTASGDPALCRFTCAEAIRICGVVDGSCPAGCSAVLDVDCAGCGNGRIEPGETCDPVTACMADASQCASDANVLRVPQGDVGTCRFKCMTSPRMCGVADDVCPMGCGPTLDRDCAGCGNGKVEMGETCDPVAQCQERALGCVSDANVVRTPAGDPATCGFTCSEGPRACGPADGRCPTGCLPTQDIDCNGCGNGRLEPGETCDPVAACTTLATACVSDADFIRMGVGDPAMCGFSCVPALRPCGVADGFCPGGCGPAADPDCAGCGNAKIEMGETCDPVAQCQEQALGCVSDANMVRTPTGNPELCGFVCKESPRMCGALDGACPNGCGPTADPDCPGCGNGKLEMGESCDPVADCALLAAGCVSNADFVRTGIVDVMACHFECVATPRACGPADDACPAGCSPTADPDCRGCGNGKVEMGETCDPCKDVVSACVSDADTIRTPSGDAAKCTFVCAASVRPCIAGDRFCPSRCNPQNDRDCVAGPGSPCDDNAESSGCQGGLLCIDKRCCTKECGTCQMCSGPGGACENVPAGQKGPGCREADAACDGKGACRLANGADCEGVGQCASGFCNFEGYCCDSACQGPCRTCGDSEFSRAGTCRIVTSGACASPVIN